MTIPREDRIRERAHEIWEREGRPEGRHDEHWRLATEEIDREFQEATQMDSLRGASLDPAEPAPARRRRAAAGSGAAATAAPAEPARRRKAATVAQADQTPEAAPKAPSRPRTQASGEKTSGTGSRRRRSANGKEPSEETPSA
ncbi:DUF2934 domain-containing protein [Rubellimicrobium roseum]|uniref:DUF2934 domain-containing protein n=1 Tax=Rubellimicrobium roseum TaxID=687525 RepID=A0A5C4N6U7_9RHOB|nr:DUF2934 domain-containing protein [Rubellimicrobium roseum]TNC61516.1 DUF2934 domain-containing protein [Rubellimicrobium roseum]